MNNPLPIRKHSFIKVNGKLIDTSKPLVMGILNLSPESFFKESFTGTKLIEKAADMLQQGATFLDLGAMSSKPGSAEISFIEERERLIPALKCLVKEFPDAIISIDTFRGDIAREALNEGAGIINDIYAGRADEQMFKVVSDAGAPIILMHMQGTPSTMQQKPFYNHVGTEVFEFLITQSKKAQEAGIQDIILDPGFGFGKTLKNNYELLHSLHQLSYLSDCIILAGLSRKSMITRLLNIPPEEALNGTTALHLLALQQGATILRVHDVKEAVQIIQIHNFYSNNE